MFNCANYISRCAESIFNQDYDSIEYIFVDDCSTDETLITLDAVLNRYPYRKQQVKIIHHNENKGVSTARNSGLEEITGNHLLFVDADDWALPGMISRMVACTMKENADITWCDYNIVYDQFCESGIRKNENVPSVPEECIKKLFMRRLHAGLWNKLLSTHQIKEYNLRFPESLSAFEDIYFITNYLLKIKKVHYVPEAYYNYFQNPDSITGQRDKISFDSEIHVVRLLEKIIPKNLDEDLNLYKAIVKRNILFSGFYTQHEVLKTYPEANNYIKQIHLSPLDRVGMSLALKNFRLGFMILLKIRFLVNMLRRSGK